MLDTNWLVEGAKYVGSAVAGVLGTQFTARRKRQRIRKNLHKELAYNYSILRDSTDTTIGMARIAYTDELTGTLRFDYLEHAKRDMDTFQEVPESSAFESFYEHLRELKSKQGELLWFNARLAVRGLERMLDGGRFNKKLFLKYVPEKYATPQKEDVEAPMAPASDGPSHPADF